MSRSQSIAKTTGKFWQNYLLKFDQEIEYDSDGILSVRNIDAILALKSNLNYGRTLRNLSKILKTETFTDKDFASLFNLQYQCVCFQSQIVRFPAEGSLINLVVRRPRSAE